MISVDYIVLIDFGHAYTKILCWDVNKDSIFPLITGNGCENGLIPTLVIHHRKKHMCMDFFEKPRVMESVSDNELFEWFLKDLFESVLQYNSFLYYTKSNFKWNFLVTISYPSNWNKEDGLTLLQMVQKIIPPARYAIREDVGIRDIFNQFHNADRGLIVDFGFSKTAYYSDSINTIYGTSFYSVESRILDNIITSIDKRYFKGTEAKIISAIESGDLSTAQLFVRELLEKYLRQTREMDSSNISKNLILYEENLDSYYKNIEKSFRTLKADNFTPSYICLLGFANKKLVDKLKQLFPKIVIYEKDNLSIGYAVLNYFREVYKQSHSLYGNFFSEMTRDSQYSTFNKNSSRIVSNFVSSLWQRSAKDNLYDYVKRETNSTYKDFMNDVQNYIQQTLPKYFTDSIVQDMGLQITNVINEVTEQVFSNIDFVDVNDEYLSNECKKYFNIQIIPFVYVYGCLSSDLESAFDEMHAFGANLSDPRGRSQRERAYEKMIEFVKTNSLVNKVPKISWMVLFNNKLCELYILDTLCINCKTIISSLILPQPLQINLKRIQSVINYAFNCIIEEGVNGLYEINNEELIYFKGSMVGKWEKFDYDTFLLLSDLIGDKEVTIDNNRMKSIRGKGGKLMDFLCSERLSKDYPHIFKKLKEFFDVDTPYGLLQYIVGNSIDIIYNSVKSKYLYFNKK